MIRHHPDLHRLLEFSAGNLGDAEALCIRLHLDLCGECRNRVDALDSLGAVVMERQPELGLSPSVFERVLERIDADRAAPPASAGGATGVLTRILGTDLSSVPWKQSLKNVGVVDLTSRFPAQGHRVLLLKLAAGGTAPAHTHRGEEITVVLQGAFADQQGVFHQGDFVVLDCQDNHRPVAVGQEDCITLSVLSAPLRLTGRFTRLLNPFIR
ncbi:anti-sigma factor [Marinobacter sp. X15-166B]|nr:anti-sigma factor [Marinobacter sp. X15-166B]